MYRITIITESVLVLIPNTTSNPPLSLIVDSKTNAKQEQIRE